VPGPSAVLNASGSASGHVVRGVSSATSLTTGNVVVTLSGAAAFTSASSYTCVGRTSVNSDLATVVYTSGTSVTFSVTGSDKGDTVTFFCVGA